MKLIDLHTPGQEMDHVEKDLWIEEMANSVLIDQ